METHADITKLTEFGMGFIRSLAMHEHAIFPRRSFGIAPKGQMVDAPVQERREAHKRHNNELERVCKRTAELFVSTWRPKPGDEVTQEGVLATYAMWLAAELGRLKAIRWVPEKMGILVAPDCRPGPGFNKKAVQAEFNLCVAHLCKDYADQFLRLWTENEQWRATEAMLPVEILQAMEDLAAPDTSGLVLN